MAAPETTLIIRADGAEIRGRPRATESGIFVAKDGVIGIDDGAEVRRESIPRPGERGEFDLAVFSGARVVSIDLHVIAYSMTELRALRSQLKRVGQGGRRFLVEIDHLGDTVSGWARRGGQITFRDSGKRHGRHYAKAFVQWVFPDPILVGRMRSTVRAGSIRISHKGDAPIAPLIDVYGPFPNGYTITAAGLGQVVVTTALPAGAMETVDVGASRVYRNGVRVLGAISYPGRWEIPGGELGVVHSVTGAGGTGTIQGRIYDAYE
ncbi:MULTISPECIES: hypothetical protein [unclassified Microbacterium]|uniref:hypothetical protein n=1 Tax=unclassified Microbacterium TaxID=2609290 RepID=UPI00300FA0E3